MAAIASAEAGSYIIPSALLRVETDNEPYDGDDTLIVITENGPNPDVVIFLDGVFYTVVEVLGGDSLLGTVKYRARAVPTDEPVPIRNNSL